MNQASSCSFPDRLPLILLAGPTGVGKTFLSLKLAERLGTEIINADSMQVYRHMDIGTAKATPEDRHRVPHHLLDVVEPFQSFDAARYRELALPVVEALHGQGRVPLVVGGTGLYMKVLTQGICPSPPIDPAVREDLMREATERGLSTLHEELCRVDPELGARLHPRDRQRILRALEVYRASGTPLSLWQKSHRFTERLFPAVKVFLTRDREEVYQRIDRRVLAMMEEGFLHEVSRLLAMGFGPELKPMQSLGYRQLVRHLQGELSSEAAVEEIQRETRRYAKRQMTWFRADPEFRWMDAGEPEAVLDWVEEAVRRILETP